MGAAFDDLAVVDDEDHIRAWLLRVAINRARDQKRSFWEKHRVSWEDYMETLSFEAPEDKSLFEAVMSLPAKYRTVIHLFTTRTTVSPGSRRFSTRGKAPSKAS